MKTLLVGYVAADLSVRGKHGKPAPSPLLTEGDVTCHTLDVYHRHAIEKTVHAKAVCSAHLPEGPWDLIRFRTGPKVHSGELALDLLQEIYRLAPEAELFGGAGGGTRVELDFVGREGDRNELLDKIRKDRRRVRDFSARWTSSVPGHGPVPFVSFPGCFCHRRPDEGGLALAEVVSRELSDRGGSSTWGADADSSGFWSRPSVPGSSSSIRTPAPSRRRRSTRRRSGFRRR